MKRLKKLLLGALTILSLTCVATACSCAGDGDFSGVTSSSTNSFVEESSSSQSSSSHESSSAPESSSAEDSSSTHEHEHSYESSVTTDPTCTSTGVRTYTCACGNSYTETIAALGHDTVQVEAKTPTCAEFGWNAYETCARCDYTTYEVLPATGAHNFIKGECTVCGSKDHEHEWDEGVVTTEPTCLSPGIKTYTCWCTGTKTESVDALGHDRVQHEAQKATCTKIGWEAYETCSRCDYTTYKEIAVLGHDYQGITCLRCGERNPNYFSEGLEYTLSSNGAYYGVLGIGACKDTDIVIPSTYNDLPVTRIGSSAFYNCSSLTSVMIPDSVTSIGSSAFSGCRSLMSIEIPNSVTSIDWKTFADCSSLTSVVIPDSVTSISGNAFSYCSSLTSVVIPDSVTSIGEMAFACCSSLKSVVIPDSVTSIGGDAFRGCSSLKSITFNGTKAQWNAIKKADYWKYDVPATKVVCIDGTISV